MRAWACAFTLCLAAAGAAAETVVLEAVERGRVFWTGGFTSPVIGPEEAYHVGRAREAVIGTIFEGVSRSVFVFDLSALEAMATAATLRVWSPGPGYRSLDRREPFRVHAVTTERDDIEIGLGDLFTTWVDLGDGAALADGVFEPAPGHYVEIPLDPRILRVLNRADDRVVLGLSLTSLENVELWRVWEERVLAGTAGPDVPPPQLVLETGPPAADAGATVLHVDARAKRSSGEGTPENPIATIAAAMDLATVGDTVQVAPGRYAEGVILKRDVALLGAGAERTVLDISDDLPSVRCADGTFDGFLILQTSLRGRIPEVDRFPQAVDCSNGTSPLLSNLAIATRSNGIRLADSNAVIAGCRIGAGMDPRSVGGFGANGIIAARSSPTLTDSRVHARIALTRIDLPDVVSDPVRIQRNELRGRVELVGFSAGELTFTDNLLLPPDANPLFTEGSSGLEIAYSPNAGLIAGNTLLGTAGILVAWGHPAPAATHVTLANNVVAGGFAGISVGSFSSAALLHNAVFGNEDDSGVPTDYRGVDDPTGSDGNLGGLAPGALDGFEPAEGSPLVDAGENGFVELDALDVDGDPRVADGDGDLEATVDIGAQERPAGLRTVAIDFLPGKENVLRARPPKKKILVGILSEDGFDAPGDVDLASLALQGRPVLLGKRGAPACRVRGVDSKDADDLVCAFPGEALGGLAGVLLDRRVCLTGETVEGDPFRGCDAFTVRR